MAILLLLVGIAIAYDTFIKDENSINAAVNITENLGALSQFILKWFNNLIDRLVSSQSIMSDFFKTSIARIVISSRVPMGVETIYKQLEDIFIV